MGPRPAESVPSNPAEGDQVGPGFFLSYARIPPLHGDRSDPAYWELIFFHDLLAAVQSRAPELPEGFIAGHVPPGADPEETTGRRLANCRVFVPLYCDDYFVDEQCGREWAVFEERRRLLSARTGDHGSAVLPVLWKTSHRNDRPPCIADTPPARLSGSELYHRLGLNELIRLYQAEYKTVVSRLAELIVWQARTQAPPIAAESALAEAVPAFPSAGHSARRLYITVVANVRSRVPTDRDPDFYGDSPEQWRPYQPADSEPLAHRAARLAQSYGWRPEIGVLTPTSPEARMTAREHTGSEHRQPPAPAILLADPWQFASYQGRRVLEKVDSWRKDWVRLMVPWSAADRETAEHRTRLESHTRDAVPWMYQSWRRACPQGLEDLATPAEFDEALPAVIDRARSHFLDASRPLRGSPPHRYSVRPRLVPSPEDETPQAPAAGLEQDLRAPESEGQGA